MDSLPIICYLQLVQHVMAGNSYREVRQVGDTIYLHPTWRRGDIEDARWKKSNHRIFKSEYESKWVLFENGSLLIKTADKNDEGNYTVDLYDHSGHWISKTDIELILIEAVSQPEIHSSCTVDGRIRLSCSVDRGDHVMLQWTFFTDLPSLSQQPAEMRRERTLYLFSNTPGHVVCVALNPVGKKSSNRTIVGKCRGRIPVCIVFGLFISTLVCSMALLKLYKKPTRNSDDTENIYITMQGFRERTLKNPVKEAPEVDNSIYVTCEFPPRAVHAET